VCVCVCVCVVFVSVCVCLISADARIESSVEISQAVGVTSYMNKSYHMRVGVVLHVNTYEYVCVCV